MSPQRYNASWYLEHVWAALAAGSFVYLYWVMTHFDLDAAFDIEKLQMQVEGSRGIILAGTASFIAAIVFWFHMFGDFFRKEPERYALAWGIFLFVGAHLAALFYFFMIWRPRQKGQ